MDRDQLTKIVGGTTAALLFVGVTTAFALSGGGSSSPEVSVGDEPTTSTSTTVPAPPVEEETTTTTAAPSTVPTGPPEDAPAETPPPAPNPTYGPSTWMAGYGPGELPPGLYVVTETCNCEPNDSNTCYVEMYAYDPIFFPALHLVSTSYATGAGGTIRVPEEAVGYPVTWRAACVAWTAA